MMGGAAVMWAVRSQLQPSLSSAEAELYGLSTAVCDILAFLNVLEEIVVRYKGIIAILVDSRAARLIAEDCASTARTRHIHRRWFFVQHYINEEVVCRVLKDTGWFWGRRPLSPPGSFREVPDTVNEPGRGG